MAGSEALSPMTRRRKPRNCPRCGSREIVTVLYGLGSPLTPDEERRFELGGCEITDRSPTWVCRGCRCGILPDGSVADPTATEP
jgi:hypothetical protein